MTTSRSRGSVGTRAGAESSGAEAIRDFVEDVRELLEYELRNAQEELAGKFRVASEGALVLGVAVVLGGIYSRCGPGLLDAVRAELAVRVVSRPAVDVRYSALGPHAALRGAATSVVQDLLTDPAAGAPHRRKATILR